MKRLSVLSSCALLLSACSVFQRNEPVVAQAPVRVTQAQPQLLDANGAPIEVVRFRPGISSATVEKMAQRQGCSGGVGAGLVTPPGPVEVYKMQCDNGKVFRARCDLRQCKPM